MGAKGWIGIILHWLQKTVFGEDFKKETILIKYFEIVLTFIQSGVICLINVVH